MATEPKYGKPPASIVTQYRSFLLAHPSATLEVAPGYGGSYIVRFSGADACDGEACMTTVLLPDRHGGMVQAFAQKVGDLRIIAPAHGTLPLLQTDDGGVWVPVGTTYIEDLHSLGSFRVPTHYLGGGTKQAVDAALVGQRWPLNSPYVVDVVPASGNAPETMIVTPDQKTRQGINLCSGIACPLWILVPGPQGGWRVDIKTAGSGAYAILRAVNEDGGHDLGVADQWGWNQYSWSDSEQRWTLTRVVANFPAAAH